MVMPLSGLGFYLLMNGHAASAASLEPQLRNEYTEERFPLPRLWKLL